MTAMRPDDAPRIAAGRWVADHAHPITATDVDAPLTELGPLSDHVRGATVVALGASARTTHELSVVAHRLVRYLVDHHGFRAFALEGDEAASVELDDYLRGGDRDPVELLGRARPFWRTRDILDTITWLRAFNERNPDDQVGCVHPNRVHPVPTVPGEIERAVAESVVDWHERTGRRIVYWGGIAHTHNAPGSAGGRLRARFGRGYVSVGLLFHHGDALEPVPDPPADFAEAVLGGTGRDAYLLDLHADPDAPERAWLDTVGAKARLVGPRFDPAVHLGNGAVSQWFDVVAYVHEVSPVQLLATPHLRPSPLDPR